MFQSIDDNAEHLDVPLHSLSGNDLATAKRFDPNLLNVLQHSLSTMDLNVNNATAIATTNPVAIPAVATATTSVGNANAAKSSRRSLRSDRGDPKSTQAPLNRRTIGRPRRLSNLDAACTLYLAGFSDETAASTSASAPASSSSSSSTTAAPIPKEIERFYTNATKSARIKPTCLETIDELSEGTAADYGATSSPAAAAVAAAEALAANCNFLSVRKLRRCLTFAAAKAHQPHQRNTPASKMLSMRRRRRIRDKLGARSRTGTSKFSMQVFMEKMRALQEESELADEHPTVADMEAAE